MKPALYLALLLAQAVSGPTCILSPCFFYAPQQGQIIWHADGSYACPEHEICAVPTAQEIKQHRPVTDWPVIVGTSIAEGPTQTSLRIDRTYGPVVIVESQTGRIERLTSTEYAGLQNLRQAVADEETRIAKAHGVYFESPHCIANPENVIGSCVNYPEAGFREAPSDQYEFRGQFLLINVSDAAPERSAK